MTDTTAVRAYLLGLQGRVVQAMQDEDGLPFRSDAWQRPEGGKLQGDGLSQLLEEGHMLERGGCNFSHVQGASLPPSATQHRGELAGAPFEALGVSLVMHPRNPYVPTVHMNVRLLAAFPQGKPPVTWFGGGMDLTPYYGFEADAHHFHRVNADALAPSLDIADAVVFLHRPELAWDAGKVVSAIRGDARTAADADALIATLRDIARAGDHVVFMSNGGFDGAPRRFLAALG